MTELSIFLNMLINVLGSVKVLKCDNYVIILI